MADLLQIQICSSTCEPAVEIVHSAFVRSFTTGAIRRSTVDSLSGSRLLVLINPEDNCVRPIKALLKRGGKVLVLGGFSTRVGDILGLTKKTRDDCLRNLDYTEPCEGESFTHSPGSVCYQKTHPLAEHSVFEERPFCRFDFMDEWNNLGYGRITTDKSPWSVSGLASADSAVVLSEITENCESQKKVLGAYSTVKDYTNGAALWFNRAVGPVDSHEWSIVESFFSDYRAGELSCVPALSEIPYDCDGMVSMRLDCDEAVSSARDLFDVYSDYNLPFSLAIKTSLPLAKGDLELVADVFKSGGSVLSHSHTHPRNWGRDYEQAFSEAKLSKKMIEDLFPEAKPVQFAVSPFHSNETWSMQALSDAGYKGVVTGIIQDYPEFLIARGGQVPFVTGDLISHSQQCMLHGDCYTWQGHSVDVPIQSFDNHLKANSAFGYLDHPFSERYSYGWHSESERIGAHEQLINHINTFENIHWVSQSDLLEYLSLRNKVEVLTDFDGRFSVASRQPEHCNFYLKYKNSRHRI